MNLPTTIFILLIVAIPFGCIWWITRNLGNELRDIVEDLDEIENELKDILSHLVL